MIDSGSMEIERTYQVRFLKDPAKLSYVLLIDFSSPIESEDDFLIALEEYVVIQKHLNEENQRKVKKIQDFKDRNLFFKE